MAEVKLTQAQQAVVENRGGALLVSAAGGLGQDEGAGRPAPFLRRRPDRSGKHR